LIQGKDRDLVSVFYMWISSDTAPRHTQRKVNQVYNRDIYILMFIAALFTIAKL
jgi:hypothetical protein